MDVLSSRILLRPSSLDRSRRFYRDLLGLAICREFGPPDDPGLVFFLGQGLLEVSGHAAGPPGRSVLIWIQVRDVHAGHVRLAAAGVPIVGAGWEPWGLIEMWIEDPNGVRIVLVEVPADHPLRRDPRPALPLWRRPVGRITARSTGNAAAQRPPCRRQMRTFAPRAAMYKYTGLAACLLGRSRDCQWREELLITAHRPADMLGNLVPKMTVRRHAEPSDLCPATRMTRWPTTPGSA